MTPSTPTRLRKRARVSYYVPSESDIESDVDSGYNSESSEWGSRSAEKQPKAKRARKEKPQKPFPFLSLPAELRNRIYHLALEDPDEIKLCAGWRSHRRVAMRVCTCNTPDNVDPNNLHVWRGQSHLIHPRDSAKETVGCENRRRLSPALLATSKQIYAEAAEILYSQPLHFADTTALHNFMGPLSNNAASMIHSVIIHAYPVDGRGVAKAMNVSGLTLLRSCTNLQVMRIETQLSWRSRAHDVQSGEREGCFLARQIYRDGAFWLDCIGPKKACQVVQLQELEEDAESHTRYWDEQGKSGYEIGMRRAQIAFKEELASLLTRGGKAQSRAKKQRKTR